ncbi:TM0106 family RecB-like putative nuclease [Legionella cherrii]|uniref:RNA helicase n=2 Tax=Legionella cherrii TaxID=28084 RepID=A0ABY6T576_9GAMM|nr:TM0106 family RecB-like putative nuclease [Legionella cherrii]VEB35718.1 putative RNA helicase [Legionella cherrii]
MYIESSHLVFSPSDLTQFMESPFVSWIEHLAVVHPDLLPSPDAKNELVDVLQHLGNQHELDLLTQFKQQGLSVVNLHQQADTYDSTLIAMKSGADVIYQAHLQLLPFQGYADFLIKIPGKSRFGDYCYEVWDTKLAKSVKPSFLLQLCCYAEMLEAMQGGGAEFITVVLGNQEQRRFRTADYLYFYQNLKQQFLSAHQNFDFTECPDPAASKNWGRWSNYAEELLTRADHLIQVATITSGQVKKLQQADINTMTELAHTTCSWVKGIKPERFVRLQAQAKIQKASRGKEIPLYQLMPHVPGQKQGLALLPPASPHDIFFDIEGFPLEEGGLEYLWGVTYFDEKAQRQYKDFWAHNAEQEKEAFQGFVMWAYQRWQEDPKMHIYHYANYEISACRRLMGRYGVCEDEVDQLLRNEVFVDLYKIVKNSLIVGEPRYSIKNIEHLYRGKRNTEVGSGGDSVVVYEHWREKPDGENWQTSKILNDIRAYNIDDCNSTQELVDWLRERQLEQGICYLGKTEPVALEVKTELSERIQLRDRLLMEAERLKAEGDLQRAKINLIFAWSIEFHRREAKPVFWRMFDRLGLTGEELLDDIDCLAFCRRTAKPPYKTSPRSRNLAYEYFFDPEQEFKGNAKQYFILGEETEDGKAVAANYCEEGSDLEHGIIVLQMKNEPDDPITLVPNEYVDPHSIPEAIAKQAASFEQGLLENTAILDFLSKSYPRINDHQRGFAIAPSHDPKKRLEEIIHAVLNLNNSYLTLQGPPGAGKTYTGKHLIAALVQKGKKIGISSNSHKAINNLLLNTVAYCHEEGIKGHFACTRNTEEQIEALNIAVLENKQIIDFIQPGCVVGTTVWGFAREELADAFDYLFIDEAGQVSVANLIAMSRSTRNIILMGDQMQLGQPSQGSHPEESGLSILDYLVHTTPTIPDSMGVFLGTTYRMHPAVNQFISEAIYEGKLETDPQNAQQIIKVPEGYKGVLNKEAGIIPISVFHEGNTQASDEEVEQIVLLTQKLLGRTFKEKKGLLRTIGWKDILFVAPYNHQVSKLKAALGEQAKVGSVDKFQGQEAPIVFLSMCASNVDESPRGLSFLFDKNRINVAISRAQCLAIVVYSPTLLEATPTNIEQIAMMNVFCRLVKH